MILARDEELKLIDNYPDDKIIKGQPAFCAISLQSELSECKRDFKHSHIKKKWQWKWNKSEW